MALDATNCTLDAVTAVETALKLEESAEYLAHYARLLAQLKRMGDAASAADKALSMHPNDALTLDTIGCVFSRLGQHDRAIPIFQRSVAQQPDHPQFRFNLATSRQFAGDFDQAEKEFEHILAVAPGFIKAHAALSALRTQTPEDNHIDRLEEVLERVRDPAARLHLLYALAKECEDIGRDDDAFEYLRDANTARKTTLGYTIDKDRALFESIKSAFPSGRAVESGRSTETAATEHPIFVIGMPRSGTTLVDRIISSHPNVESAGELQTLPLVIKKMSGSKTPVVLDEDTINHISSEDLDDLRERYLSESKAQRRPAVFFTDKLPLNFFNAGFIVESMPDAKIVCLRRNPMDTVWSNYKHLFATNFSYYNYSYDVRDTAEYVALFNDLMDHWDTVIPEAIHHVKYENLVSNFDAEVRELISYLGLPWSDACLRFNENQAAVATPSAVQVRSPVYAGSVGKWKRFGRHLGEAAAVFEQRGIEYE